MEIEQLMCPLCGDSTNVMGHDRCQRINRNAEAIGRACAIIDVVAYVESNWEFDKMNAQEIADRIHARFTKKAGK